MKAIEELLGLRTVNLLLLVLILFAHCVFIFESVFVLMSSITLTKSAETDDVFANISSIDLRKAIDSLCAGYIAGSAGILVGHPLDSMKVLLQTSNSDANTIVSPQTTGSVNASVSGARNLSSVAKVPLNVKTTQLNPTPEHKRSLRALYAGVSGPLLTIGMVASVNFALYDTFRRTLYRKQQSNDAGPNRDYLNKDSLVDVAISSTAAGGIVSFATSPLMVVKTKQQVMLWSMRKAAKDTLVHQGGVRNFYSGFGAHFICDSVGRGVYFTSYEYLKRLIVSRNRSSTDLSLSGSISNNGTDSAFLSLQERMLCASVAGMLSWSVIFPFDVIRSRTYAQAAILPNKDACPSSSEVARDVWRKGGYRPFFKGFGITVARAGPVAATVLPIYDLTLDWLAN